MRAAIGLSALLLLSSGCATAGLSAEEISAQLASPEPETRRALARNPLATPEALAALSKDPDDLVRTYVVENPKTRPVTIRAMSGDKALVVMDALSRCAQTPPERLTFFARQFRPDSHGHVFWQQLIDNPSTPVDVRLELLGKITVEEEKAAGSSRLSSEVMQPLVGGWRFEVGPWTRMEKSESLARSLTGSKTQELLSALKAEKYSLTLTETRAAKLECQSCDPLVGIWNVREGRVRVELRSRRAISLSIEGPLPSAGRLPCILQAVPSPARSGSTAQPSSSSDSTFSVRWTLELQRAP